MIPLTKFFCNKHNIDKLLRILNGKTKISLRLIDWFVTNYAKKNHVMYNKSDYIKLDKKKKTKKREDKESFANYFIVFNNYKSQLKEVSKKHFDPFCRRSRINFYYDKDKFILTTVGQLNFFKWAIEHYIIEYIEDNFDRIENDMNENSKEGKSKKNKTKTSGKEKKGSTKKKSNQRKKRKELSISASKSIMKHNYPTTIKFD